MSCLRVFTIQILRLASVSALSGYVQFLVCLSVYTIQ